MKKENLKYLRKVMEHFDEEERPFIIDEIEVAIDCYYDERTK